ncbi:MAG: SGNH hydrolase domain-containing protein, partial [Actinomycetota bacterium]
MTPIEARKSIVRGMGTCHVSYPDTEAKADCVFGDPQGDKTIALIGDSVAQQWFPAFQRAARANHWRLLAWTKNACPVVDVQTFQPRLKRAYSECVDWRQNVFDRIEAFDGGVDLVVIGRATYAGPNLLARDGSPNHRPLAQVWREASARTFTRLLRSVDRVVAFEDTPVAPVDIPSCLSESPEAPDRCAFPRKGSANRDGVIARAERAAAPRGVSVIDLTRHVCPADPCRVLAEDGTIIYRDRHHMTARFSASLAAVIAAIARAALAA